MNSDNSEQQSEAEPSNSKQRFSGKSIVAAVFSALIPGCGQLYLGRKSEGFLFLTVFAAFVTAYLAFRFPHSYYGLILSTWFLLILSYTSAVKALRAKSERANPSSWLWLLLLLPMGLASTTFLVNILVLASGFKMFGVPSTSMEQTIRLNDHVIADMRAFRNTPPHAGDVVIFWHDGLFKTKRAIAIGGSTISSINRVIYVDGRPLTEPYAWFSLPLENANYELSNFGIIKVPSDRVFVLGDSRDVSLDSRTFGPIEVSAIVGRVLYVVRPLSRAGLQIH